MILQKSIRHVKKLDVLLKSPVGKQPRR